MRGHASRQTNLFVKINLEELVPAHHPLRAITRMLDTGRLPGYDILERVKYTPCGFALHCPPGDYNGGGYTNWVDYGVDFAGQYGSGTLMSDFNRSGTRSSDDVTAFATAWYAADPDAPESSGWVSHPDAAAGGHDNTIGYCGYVFNPETGDYTVRFRTYMPSLGRWGERDPAGQVDGLNTYGFVRAGPTQWVDPVGLATTKGTEIIGKGLKLYWEVCGYGTWAELKVLSGPGKGVELSRWRWGKSTDVIQEVLEHGGKRLPGVPRRLASCVEEKLGQRLLTMLRIAESNAGRGGAAALSGAAARRFSIGGLFLTVLGVLDMTASRADAAVIQRPKCMVIELDPAESRRIWSQLESMRDSATVECDTCEVEEATCETCVQSDPWEGPIYPPKIIKWPVQE